MPSVAPLASPLLSELLVDVEEGRLQLPDFQRDWKWTDDHIRSLLATLTLQYPMGVVMVLHTGGGVRFKARPLEGTDPARIGAPSMLLLDGQQRLTSLFQALRSGRPVTTRDASDKLLQRWYYVDIAKALDDAYDREEAIVSVPADRIVHGEFGRGVALDLTTRDKEREAGMFPLELAFDYNATFEWSVKFSAGSARAETWMDFHNQVVQKINTFQVPMINLGNDTPKEAVCIVFEKVNTRGVALNVFELLTATYAGDTDYFDEHGHDFELREDWERIRDQLVAEYPHLDKLESTDFLQAVTLVASYDRHQQHLARQGDPSRAPAVGVKRKDILDLKLTEYLTWSPRITDAMAWAAAFVQRQGVYRAIDIPYQTQLVPLAAIRTVLGERANDADVEEKLTRWYWCGVLGGLYSGTTDTRIARDLTEFVQWLDADGRMPSTVEEATFRAGRLNRLRTRNSAAYKGVYALILRQGCRDWYFNNEDLNAARVVDYQVEIQEVFPAPKGQPKRQQDERYGSIVNKTPLSNRASRTVSRHRPSAYLAALERESGLPNAWLDDIVATHLIDPKHLRADDFDAFYQARSEELIRLIEKAMGKPVVRGSEGAEE